MSSLNTKYFIFNKEHGLNIKKILIELYSDNIEIMNWCKQYDFINCDLQKSLENYPKFLTYYNFINQNTVSYNQNKIMSTTSMSLDQLNASIIDDTCFTLLNKIKKIPNEYINLKKEYKFQNNYIKKFNDIYNKNLFIYNYSNNEYNKTFSSLLNEIYDSSLDNLQINIIDRHSFFHFYFLKSLFNYYFDKNNTLNNNLINNMDSFDFVLDLPAIIEKNKNTLLNDVIEIILINQYNFTNVSDSFKQNTINSISNEILGINNIFINYISDRLLYLKTNFLKTFFDIYNHAFSFNFVNITFSSKSYFNFRGLNSLSYNLYLVSDLSEFDNRQIIIPEIQFATNLNDFENQIVAYYRDSLNSFSILKQYFYLLYLNRHKFEKFINIIDLVSSQYVSDNIILSDIYYFNKFSHLKNLFIEWKDNIYFDKFNNKINYEFTSTKQIQFLNQNTNIINFSFVYEIYNIIEDFIESDEFSNYILNIQKSVYEYLRNSGFIDKNIDWCGCDLPLNIYFMSFFKQLVLDDDLINVSNIKNYISQQISIGEYNRLNKDSFNEFLMFFIDENADKMFEFYQTFVVCLNSNIFSKAIHNIYKL